MNVLIIGDNKINDYVCEYFTQRGMVATVISDVHSLRSLTGEVGAFTARLKGADTGGGSIDADFVVVTEQPGGARQGELGVKNIVSSSVTTDGGAPLVCAGTRTLVEGTIFLTPNSPCLTPSTEPVVFLLDYICESPMAATISALSDAIAFAQKKRQVYYLAKFIRTAGRGVEALYSQARELGVTFIKYEDIQISADQNEEDFTISVSGGGTGDGEFAFNIKTKNLFSDGDSDVGERFAYVAEKLNLTVNKFGYLTEDRYFLAPALTSRRGVYHLARDLIAERLDEGLDFIYSLAVSGIWEKPSHGVAKIDGKKCVFCYNCFRACPHAALAPDLKENCMKCLSQACAGCGICASLCPANAITLEKETAVIKDTRRNKALVVYCENTDSIDTNFIHNCFGEALPVTCGGLIDVRCLSDGLVSFDRIMSVVCPDDACRHFDGNKRACAQTKRLQCMLEEAGISADKLHILKASHTMPGVNNELEVFLGGYNLDSC